MFSGRAVYECLGKETELCENQALFVPPDISHRYIGSDENLVKASVAFSVGTSGIFADTNAQKIVFSQDVTENMNFILEHCDKEDAFVPSLISGRTLEIIYSVLNTLKIKLPKNDEQKSDPRFLVAKEYISENKNRIITCEDVAKECCLSVKQISRIFKSCTGGSLFEYITEVRLKEAKRLLLHGEYRVKEVGYMLGFENECSFTAFFKRHCGTSPGSYRRQRLYEK